MTHAVRTACIVSLLLVSLSASANAANTPPYPVSFPTLNTTPLVADGVTEYTLTATVGDADGYDDITCVRALFNFTEAGGNQAKGRGYMAWGKTDAIITRFGGVWTLEDAVGGGRWGYPTDRWGSTVYIQPVSCSTWTSGSASGAPGQRTVVWTFTALPAWAWNPLTNDADLWIEDSVANVGWLDNPDEFEVVAQPCSTLAAVPNPPVVSNITADTADIAINPADSSSDLFAIRVSSPYAGDSYLQPDGTMGPTAIWQTKAQWGTLRVTGLESSTTYTFSAKAIPIDPGGCPSAFGPGTEITTGVLVRSVDTSVGGQQIHRGIIGNATRLDAFPSMVLSWQKMWEVLHNTCARGIAGGLCADTYNWKDMSGQGVGHTGTPGANVPTTLDWMRLVRDHQSMPLIAVNTRGTGPLQSSGWCRFYYTDTSVEMLSTLAAHWVRYINFILPNYRQGDVLPPADQAIVDSINWYGKPKLLAPGENPTPKVIYWEIGNEPEVPLPWCTPDVPKFPYTPQEYAHRYKQITQAMLAVDPTIKVGPCITSANNGNEYLDAVLADPTNRVDFVSYHPYGLLYSYAVNYGDTPENAERALRQTKGLMQQYHEAVVARVAASGRNPATMRYMASEWNVSHWQWECSPQIRRVSHALGVAENIFAFAELGVFAANYWSHPAWCGDGTETPGYKVFKMLQQLWGDQLLNSYADGFNTRIYTTWNPQTYTVAVWAINFSNTRDKEVRLRLEHIGKCTQVRKHVLANLTGPTSLFDRNDPPNTRPPLVDWTTTDITGQIEPADFTVTLPRATITVFEIKRAFSRLMPEGTPAVVTGWPVTAAYPSEGYLYISPEDRSFGIRVSGSFSGISVGDRVNVTGTLTVRKPDGKTPSERQISASSIVKVSSGNPLEPLGVSCRSVGGGNVGPLPGVRDGFGANNIGSLVKIAGRVTDVRGNFFYVDDGSGVQNLFGSSTPVVGVMVRAPSAPPVAIGDIVTVIGVIEGSIPLNWQLNRAFIRTRSMSDITVINRPST